MPRIGDTIRPELGRQNYGSFLAGTQQGAAAMGRGIQQMGQGIGDYLKRQKEAQKDTKASENLARAFREAYGEESPIGRVAAEMELRLADQDRPLKERHADAGSFKDMMAMMLQKSAVDKDDARYDRERTFMEMQTGIENTRADAFVDINRMNAEANQSRSRADMLAREAQSAATQALADINSRAMKPSDMAQSIEAFAPDNPEAVPLYKGMVAEGIEEERQRKEDQEMVGATTAVTMSPEEKKYRTDVASFVADWETSGRQIASGNMKKLDAAIKQMESGGIATGALQGAIPTRFRPKTKALQQEIASIVYQTLRATLGAQFTEKEGERLLAIAFDDELPEKENLKKVKTAKAELEERIKAAEGKVRQFRSWTDGGQEIPQAEQEAPDMSLQDMLRALKSGEAQKKSSPRGEPGNTGVSGPPGARNETPDTPTGDFLSMVKQFEGWNPKAYSDYGQTSIGYGTKAKPGEKEISREEGERRLLSELEKHRRRVDEIGKKHGYDWTPSERDALTSFDYNTGRLEQLTANGKRSKDEIAKKILLYRKAGGKVLRGLERRRLAEQRLFLNGYAS